MTVARGGRSRVRAASLRVMALLVFGMNQSLDGFVDHDHAAFAPGPELFDHFVEQTRSLSGSLYGRRMYEIMRYWDDDQPEWDDAERAYAAAWRAQPKWVVSSTLTSVGPNATLATDLEATARRLRDEVAGEIEVAGPVLAAGLTRLDLVDEYRMYVHPVVLGTGRPYFAGPAPRLRLQDCTRLAGDVVRLTYTPVRGG